jgi:RHS repeat-associated protein
VDESTDGADPTQPSATNTDWVAFQNQYAAATVGNPPSLAEQLGNLPLYAGYWWDDAIGLYHVRHRVYRPEWGRWLQRDPLGYAPGWNLYQYVNGMPWSAVDPMGLWGIGEWFSDLWESIKGIASTPSDAVSTANQMGQLKRQRNNAEEQNAYMVIDRNENRALYQEATNRPNSKDFNYAASTAASAVDIVVRNTAPTADAIESTAEALDRVFDSPNLANISLLGLALFVSQPGGAIGKEAAACGAKASGQLHHAISRRVHAALELHPVLKGVYKARDNRFVTRAKDLPSHIGYGDWHIALDDEVIQWLSDNPSANPAEFENWLRSRYEHDDLKSRFPSGLMD